MKGCVKLLLVFTTWVALMWDGAQARARPTRHRRPTFGRPPPPPDAERPPPDGPPNEPPSPPPDGHSPLLPPPDGNEPPLPPPPRERRTAPESADWGVPPAGRRRPSGLRERRSAADPKPNSD
ncbi:uncharacterized protein LOC144912747 [Branchiostoma floridae x Branchiostoma belcheri]